MKLLQSSKFRLPTLYLVWDRSVIKDIPIGVPFIYAEEKLEKSLITLLEYEIIYATAIKTGLPFNFKLLLEEAGFKNLKKLDWQDTLYMQYVSDNTINSDFDIDFSNSNVTSQKVFKEYLNDSVAYVDIRKLKDLNVFPVWMDTIEKAIETNIHNFSVFNNNMYNKKLEGMYGALELTSPNRNLINMDWSSSIPKAIATTTALIAKQMAESFYCDLLITAHSTILIPYEELGSIDMEELYNKYNSSQECVQYRKLITEQIKHYNTCIIFGDNHSVCEGWNNSKTISREEGKKLCKWTIDKLICFHTTSDCLVPGFADWFSPKETEHVKDWVKYLD